MNKLYNNQLQRGNYSNKFSRCIFVLSFILFFVNSGCREIAENLNSTRGFVLSDQSRIPVKTSSFHATGNHIFVDPSQIIIEVDACASGYTGTAPASNLDFNLYIGDYNCRAKVQSFTALNGEVFTIKAGEVFGYTPGQVTPFVSNLGSTADILTVANLSSPLNPADTIEFSIFRSVEGTIFDLDTGRSLLRVSSATPEVVEGDGVQITYEIKKVTQTDTNALDVYYHFTGSAIGGTDYVIPSGMVTIPAGQTSVTFTVDIINDAIGEALKVLTLNITDNANYYHYDVGNTLIYDEDAGVPATNLVMHLDPSTLVNTGGFVSGWNDQVAPGQTVDQTLAGSQPVFGGGVVNGLDAAAFDGIDDVLNIASSTDINSGGPFTEKLMFFVFETGADVSRRQIIFEQGSATGGILAYIDAGKLYFSFFENGMASPIYISTSVAVNTIYHATLDFDSVAGLLEGYLYANKFGSVSGAVALGNNSAAGIGGSNGAKVRFHDDQTTTTNTNFEGRVSEIIYYNGTPQVGTIPSVQQYLAGKYASDPIIVDVTATAASITENGGVSSNFVFTKNQPQAFDLTVYYTVSGTATANQDYVALSGSVVIPAYNLSASVSLTPIDDPDLEVSVEDVTVTLAADANYEIGTSPSASTNIVDDESANPSGDYVMWLSAESGVQLAGSNVTGWIDSSAYLQTVSQATAANQPLYDPIGISGKSAIVFDGVDDFLDIASSAELNTVDYTQKSIGLVIETPADVVSRQTIYVQGAKAKGFVIYLDSGNLYFNVWGSDNGNFNISSPVSANSIYRVLISFDGVGGELNMNINGTDLSPVTGVGPLGKHTGSINIGDSTGKVEFHDGSNATGNPFQGKLADIIYYNSVLLPTEKDSLLLYYAVTYP